MQHASRRSGLLVTLAALAATLACQARPARAGDRPSLPAVAADMPLAATTGRDSVVFAGGCFWGVEGVFEHVKGVLSATSGYAGGRVATPSYEEVSTGTTGHAESVKIIFDPSVVTYGQLLQVFFAVAHDPTELNRQGPDVGTQYRSAIFAYTEAQRHLATDYIAQLEQAHRFPSRIVTEVSTLQAFYPAEAYHQDFMAHHPDYPYIVINDRPKVEHLQAEFPALYREP